MKTGGRIFQWNAASNFTGAAYISFGPDLFYDYYVLNQFADCKVYIAEVDNFAQRELWDFYEFEGADKYWHFKTNRIQMTVVLSEKGPSSTWDKIPIQAQYRDADIWQGYRNGQKLLSSSPRQFLSGSKLEQKLKTPYRKSSGSSREIFFSKLRDKGLMWIPNKIATILLKFNLGKIKGFKYIGRI